MAEVLLLQLSTSGSFNGWPVWTLYCLQVGVWEYPMCLLSSCRKGQKTTQVVAFPEGFRFSSCYRSASGPQLFLGLELEAWMVAMNCQGALVAMLIVWCLRMSYAFIALIYSCPRYIGRSWRWFNEFGAEAWSFSWRCLGECGPKPFFAQKFGKFYYLFDLNQDNSNCDLLPSMLPDSQPSIDRGIGLSFECSFSWMFSRVETSMIYGRDPCSLAMT